VTEILDDIEGRAVKGPPSTRLQASTDAGSLAIWDAAEPSSGGTIDEAVRRGHACILRMEGDCGGAVDIFVDQDLPADVLADTTPFGDEQTIVIHSGEVTVDGIEYFDAEKAAPQNRQVCRLPNGTYRATVRRIGNEDELPEPQSEKEIRRVVGAANVEYYDRIHRNGCLLAASTLLLFPALLFVTRWYIAGPIALAVFVGYFHVQERVLRKNSRYQVLHERITKMRLAGARPLLAIQLLRVS
jgi:hypothetical protein